VTYKNDDLDNTTAKKLVVVSNGITPYGLHFLKRVAKELTFCKLITIYSYEFSMGRWTIELPDYINSIIIGKNEESGNSFDSVIRDFRRGQELIREIKKADPAAVMILGYGHISHFVVLEWCKYVGLPCLMWGDSNIKGDTTSGLKGWIKKAVVSRAVSRCTALLPCGSLGAQYFQKYGARPEQIFYVPNEPDYSTIENISPELINKIQDEFGFNPSRHRIIYSGRLIPIKRVDLLLDAFASIADQRPDWDLVIAGSGPLETELKNRLPERLTSRIVWAGFIDSTEKMSALYKCCDVLVLPSDYEPWALVINEAACAGLAIVSSDVVGAAAELVCDGVNGRLFRASDNESLIQALLDVTQAENLTKYRACTQNILNNWKQNADPVQGLFKALMYSLNKEFF
jgi:glycosyltransferase involved in cell wall biosynthesis